MSQNKIAKTNFQVSDFIKNRWSARSFSEKMISEDTMKTIIEAASWSFSAMNEQPWRFAIAYKGTPLFEKFFNLLAGGNQVWCKNAGALVLSIGKKTYTANGQLNESMMHDVGSANMLLTLQANQMGIYTHVLGGYDHAKTAEVFNLKDDFVPVYMIALGYLDEADKLAEPFKSRELAERQRKPLTELILNLE